MKYYHMVIAREAAERMGDKSTRKLYTSRKQGSHPDGWICLGVCGYFEKKEKKDADRKAEDNM